MTFFPVRIKGPDPHKINWILSTVWILLMRRKRALFTSFVFAIITGENSGIKLDYVLSMNGCRVKA